MTWGTPVQSFVFLGLLVFELEPMYATSDRQTTDADHRIMPPRRGHKKSIHFSDQKISKKWLQISKNARKWFLSRMMKPSWTNQDVLTSNF